MVYTCHGGVVQERDRRRNVEYIPFARMSSKGGVQGDGRMGARVVRSGMELQVVINEAESSLLPIGEETPGIPAEF